MNRIDAGFNIVYDSSHLDGHNYYGGIIHPYRFASNQRISIMQIIFKVLKWIGIFIAALLVLIILAGCILRLVSPQVQPPGKMVDARGYKLHVNCVGVKNDKPTLVIEAGAGAFSEYYYWIGEGLKDSMRVVRYDRAGIGYSELSDSPRDPETTARDLHTLLEKAGEAPPYIMAGHSYGGHYIRVFTEMYPDEVVGMVFLDAPHPDESERLNMPPSPGYVTTLFKIGAVLGDLGVIHLFDRAIGPILPAPGIPEEVTNRFKDYTRSGKYLKGYIAEEKWHEQLLDRAREADDFGDLPVRVFAGTNLHEEILRKRGFDPDFIRRERKKMQEEVATISTNGEVYFMKGGHFFFIEKEEADFVCEKVLEMM